MCLDDYPCFCCYWDFVRKYALLITLGFAVIGIFIRRYALLITLGFAVIGIFVRRYALLITLGLAVLKFLFVSVPH